MQNKRNATRLSRAVAIGVGALLVVGHQAAVAGAFKDSLSSQQRYQVCSSVPVDTVVTVQVTGASGTTTTGKVHCEHEDQVSPNGDSAKKSGGLLDALTGKSDDSTELDSPDTSGPDDQGSDNSGIEDSGSGSDSGGDHSSGDHSGSGEHSGGDHSSGGSSSGGGDHGDSGDHGGGGDD